MKNQKKNKKVKPKIHSTAVIESSAKIGSGTKVWHFTHVDEFAIIGENCVLGQNVYIGRFVSIGDNVHIQNNVSVYSGVSIDDDCFIGPSVVFTNVKYPTPGIPQRFSHTYVRIGAVIGANATILPGITIGYESFIGAGSVVTKDVMDKRRVAGNPAHYLD